jgi:hypothetical protein
VSEDNRSFIETDDRPRRIVRPGVHAKDVLHPFDELGADLRHDPHFFPPRLQVVFSQSHSNGLSPHALYDSTLHHLRGDEPNRPPRVAFGRRSADKRDNGGFLDAIELSLAARARVVGECRLESIRVVPVGDALHFAVVPTDRSGSGEHRQPLIEPLQREDASPGPSRKPQSLHPLQLAAIRSRQRQPWRTCRLGLHSNA